MTNGATPQQLNDLAKPIPAHLIQQDDRGNAHITARTVQNRLDNAVGRGNWATSFKVIRLEAPIMVECTLSIKVDGEWVGKTDVAVESTWSPEKSAYSNALKRAGAAWGIGRELYGEGTVYEDGQEDPPAQRQRAAPQPTRRQMVDAAKQNDPQPDDMIHVDENGEVVLPEQRTDVHNKTGARESQTTGEDRAKMLAALLESDAVFEPKNWADLWPYFVRAGLAGDEFHAHGRLRKVFGLPGDAEWLELVLAWENQDPEKTGIDIETVGDLAIAFLSRANKRALEAKAKAEAQEKEG